MAKNSAPVKLPAPEPGASPEPEAPAVSPDPAEVPPAVQEPVQGPGVPMLRYRVRNRFEGFRPEALNEGDMVEAAEEEAAPFAGKNGVLELLPEE